MACYQVRAAAIISLVLVLLPPCVTAQTSVRLDDREALQKLLTQPPMVRPSWALQVEHKVVLRHDADPAYESEHRIWLHGKIEFPDEPGSSRADQRIRAKARGTFTWRDGPAGSCAAYEGGPVPIEIDLRGVATAGRRPGFILSFQGNPQHRSSYQVPCASPNGESHPSPRRTVVPLLPPTVRLPRQAGTYVGPSPLVPPPYDAASVETNYILTADCVATPAPSLRYVVNVTTEVPEARLHHDRDRGQIRTPSDKGDSIGLTTFDLKMNSQIDATSLSTGEGKQCFWVSEINVAFRYQFIDIYLASEYPEGSCEYQAMLDHENEHIRAELELLEKFAREARAALAAAALPTYARPWWNRSFPEAMEKAEAELAHILQPLFTRFKEARDAVADTLDTSERYKEVHRRCTNW